MGLVVSSFDMRKYDGRQYMPNMKLTKFPSWRKRPPGHLVVHFNALPKGYKLAEREDMVWWPDCQFRPFTDNELLVSVGAYEARQGRTPHQASSAVHGLLHKLTFTNKTDTKVYKGTKTSSLPRISHHPGGNYVCYIGNGCIKLCNLETGASLSRDKAAIGMVYKHAIVSPNGNYIAYISRTSRQYQIGVLSVEGVLLLDQGSALCHHVSPGFKGLPSHSEQVEIKFSPDSRHIAAGSSLGELFVLKRSGLIPKCNVIPDMFQESDDEHCLLANERCFDFDPRYMHRYLALGTTSNMIYICDIIENRIAQEIALLNFDDPIESQSPEAIQSLKYGTYGDVLAVATSKATINIFNPETCDLLYMLDASAQDVHASMNQQHASGTFPEIIHLSFNRASDLLSSTATDGVVRVFQIQPNLNLQHLCRTTIFNHMNISDVPKLPLPSKIILYLLAWPTE